MAEHAELREHGPCITCVVELKALKASDVTTPGSKASQYRVGLVDLVGILQPFQTRSARKVLIKSLPVLLIIALGASGCTIQNTSV